MAFSIREQRAAHTISQPKEQMPRGYAGDQIDGILNLRKPSQSTSMDWVRWIKRLTHQRHVGHGGTLDPLAEGVLPICFGRATRLMEFLIEAPKLYQATLRLGISTDTYDSEGNVVQTRDAGYVNQQLFEQTLKHFTGVIHQIPPMYSALKQQGKRLYDLARSGVEVERPARKVQVYHLELLHWAPPVATIQIACGRGLYIRSLGHDIGVALGCGAHLEALTRLNSGALSETDGTTPEVFAEAVAERRWKSLLYPPDLVLQHLDAVVVGKALEDSIKHGRLGSLGPGRMYPAPIDPCRVYSADGRLVALMRYDMLKGMWQPQKVLDVHPID